MLHVQSLQFAYNTHTQFNFPDITIQHPEHLLILGASGIGKTTLLHLMAGLLRADTGKVEIEGTNICQLSSHQMDRFRGKHIGIVFQKPHFVRSLNLLENMLLIQYLAGIKQSKKVVKEVLTSLGIGHKMNQNPNRLSQGEQQRAAIAMAILNQPKLILADEPTSSLDDQNCHKVAELLKEQAQATQAHLIIITHDHRLKSVFQNTITL